MTMRSRAPAMHGCFIALFMLSACASFDARPQPAISEKPVLKQARDYDYLKAQGDVSAAIRSGIPTATQLAQAKLARDKFIGLQIQAIDYRYQQFLRHLSRQFRGSGLALDILGFGLSGAASVAGAGAARGLAASATAVTGSRAAISRDVFYERTLSALIDEMNAARDQAKVALLTGMKQPISEYPLEIALIDLRAYEGAPSLDTALQKLSRSASDDARQAAFNVAATRACVPAPDSFVLRGQLASHLRGLTGAANLPKLQAIAAQAGVPVKDAAGVALSEDEVRDALLEQITKSLCSKADLQAAITAWGIPAPAAPAVPPAAPVP
jgi:hypothetical protein